MGCQNPAISRGFCVRDDCHCYSQTTTCSRPTGTKRWRFFASALGQHIVESRIVHDTSLMHLERRTWDPDMDLGVW